ncbi:MAG: hypothetical protein HY749_17855 [Gammaproteobacteria bacterium]|nr:hypothetical protein [Gammaproteobacteria bacterium]
MPGMSAETHVGLPCNELIEKYRAPATPGEPEPAAGICGCTTDDYDAPDPLRRDRQPEGMTGDEGSAAKANDA